MGRIGEHGILGGEPAALDSLHFHPARNIFINSCRANDAGISKRNENRASGMGGDVGSEGNRAKISNCAAIRTFHEVGHTLEMGLQAISKRV